jgi:hypothetical protein
LKEEKTDDKYNTKVIRMACRHFENFPHGRTKMEKTYYEIRDFSDNLLEVTTNYAEAVNALANGKNVIKVQETKIYTEFTVVRTTVSQQLKLN